VPQGRQRLFMVASLNWSSPFKWPEPVPVQVPLVDLIKSHATDNPKALPPKESARQRSLVKNRYKVHLENKIDPATTMVIVDIGASEMRGKMNKSVEQTVKKVFPTVTATRAVNKDYWCSMRGRKVHMVVCSDALSCCIANVALLKNH
jgi:hypothetical protein